MGIAQLYLFILFVVYANTSGAPSSTIVLDNGNYNVSYNYSESTDALEILVEVRATGWVGFGFALNAPNDMRNYDVAVGGVTSGRTGYLRDYLTVGHKSPRQDSQQDWKLTNATEENGVTTLRFYRKRDSNDQQNDVIVQIGAPIFLIWAYHDTIDAQFALATSHNNQNIGYEQVTLIPDDPNATVTPTPFPTEVSLDGDDYKVSWTFSSSTDTLHFIVEVRATGWVGFGFATQAPTNPFMLGYDVAVGGVASGSGYLRDYLTIGNTSPRQDSQQDWKLTNATEENGVTTLKFYRKRDTNDQQNDVAVQVGMPIFLIWAYQDTLDAQQSLNSFHNQNKGYQLVTLIPADTRRPQTMTSSSSAAGTVTSMVTPTPTKEIMASLSMVTPTPRKETMKSSSVLAATPTKKTMTSLSIVRPTTTMAPSPSLTATPAPNPTTGPQFIHAYDNNRFLLSWEFDDQADEILYHVRVKTTGWVGFGFADTAPNNMLNYDVTVGGFSNGQGYLNDYFTRGYSQPFPDANQDYKLLSASEVGGFTELMLERPRDTNDSNDLAFQPGEQVHIIWAYSDKDITNDRNLGIHSRRGWSAGKVVMVTEQPTPTKAASSSPNSIIHEILTITIVLLLNRLVM